MRVSPPVRWSVKSYKLIYFLLRNIRISYFTSNIAYELRVFHDLNQCHLGMFKVTRRKIAKCMPGSYFSNEKNKHWQNLLQIKIDYDTRIFHDLIKSHLGKFKVISKSILIIVWSNVYLSYEKTFAVSNDFDQRSDGQSLRWLEEEKIIPV